MFDSFLLPLLDSNRYKFLAQFVSVISTSEVIATINKALPAEHSDLLPNLKILRLVVLFLDLVHPRVVCMNRQFGQLLSPQHQWEGILSGILVPKLLHLRSIISQEIIQREVVVSSLIRLIFPQ